MFVVEAADHLTPSQVKAQLGALKQFVYAPLSDFKVAALAVAQDGTGYAGVNMEFPETEYAQTIHAEQFALNWARCNGAKRIQTLYVSVTPCGHCRQFLVESPVEQVVVLSQSEVTLLASELLPHYFSLNTEVKPWQTQSFKALEGVEAALVWAMDQHQATVLETFNAVVLEDNLGNCYPGFLQENTAFNPTLPALQSAIINWWADKIETQKQTPQFSEIKGVYFKRNNTNVLDYLESTKSIVSKVFPNAQLII